MRRDNFHIMSRPDRGMIKPVTNSKLMPHSVSDVLHMLGKLPGTGLMDFKGFKELCIVLKVKVPLILHQLINVHCGRRKTPLFKVQFSKVTT